MQSFPFTSQVTYDEAGYPEYDRAVDSDILRNIFKNYYSNGVFPNPSTNFQVVADEGMQVVVRPGACLIEGATGYETEDRTMVVQAAGATDRIDSVVLRLNDNIDYRDIDLYVIKGNSSSEPPELTRTGGVYEIGLANLYVSANSSTITTERITDTRLVTARCGYAMPVQEFDTTALFDQLQAQVNENIELIQRAINQTEAAHLQEQIDSISSDIGTTSIASISDGTLKGAVAKHEQDVNSLNLNWNLALNSTELIVSGSQSSGNFVFDRKRGIQIFLLVLGNNVHLVTVNTELATSTISQNGISVTNLTGGDGNITGIWHIFGAPSGKYRLKVNTNVKVSVAMCIIPLRPDFKVSNKSTSDK